MDALPSAEGTPDPTNVSTEKNDPNNPEQDQETLDEAAPIGNPQQDMDATEEAGADANDAISDDESILSEIDEEQFQDFDPANIQIEERPTAVDESNVALIGKHKRKRAEGEDGEKKRKRKEGKREKSKKSRRSREDGDEFAGGEEIDGKRRRKAKDGAERRDRPRARAKSPENEEGLSPEERRKRALDRAMDEALKNPNRRRKRLDGIDIEAQNDELIENMRRRMTDAAREDTEKRSAGQPAMEKLKLLPEVAALLNRNTLRHQIVDPDINLLEAVRFFLEPLNDGSLPAFNIQRELFTALAKLPINKDALVASGIGKVTLFYTKSSKPEDRIKRQAERLLGEWTRPILKRTDDYRKRELVQADYDPTALPVRSSQKTINPNAAAEAARQRKLAMPVSQNRARVEGTVSSYNIVPRSNVASQQPAARPAGAAGEEMFRKIKQRNINRAGGGRR